MPPTGAERPAHRAPLPIPLSAVEGAVWPAPVGGMQAVTLAALQQLEQSQYLPLDELRARQFRQAGLLTAFAAKALPFWRERFRKCGFDPAAPIDAESWSRLPILTRQEVQAAGAALHCTKLPAQHGETTSDKTSGSTATPLTVRRSALALFYWNVFAIRETIWHGFDLGGRMAAIRMNWQRPKDWTGMHVARHDNWGPPLAGIYPTGKAAVLDVRGCSIAEQAEWLRDEAPSHVASFSIGLQAIARHCVAYGIDVSSIRSVYASGEVVSEATRAAVRDAWGVEIVENYSAVEIGNIATQCPEQPHLHVHAESALVEVVGDDGAPCRPGEVGRVVVTGLHNFAMPLIRYAIGDLAEVGAPCTCGRTLPVLARVLGRTRDMLQLPDGSLRFPFYGSKVFADVPGLVQHQLVQTGPARIEVRYVATAELTGPAMERLREAVVQAIGHPFDVAFLRVEAIAREPSGKYVEFRRDFAT